MNFEMAKSKTKNHEQILFADGMKNFSCDFRKFHSIEVYKQMSLILKIFYPYFGFETGIIKN